ncbi:MAG: STAS domain-containing protein [Pseudomonadota bacterium]
MNIESYEKNNFTVLKLEGEIDLSSSPVARQHILDTLNKKQNIIVDLERVEYIDSSGIASLIEGLQAAKSLSLSFVLTGISSSVMQVFQLAKLEDIFEIRESVESVAD